MKNNYCLILFAEKNIVSATSDMRKYIFPKKDRSVSFSCFSHFFFRYPFSCHVVPFPVFRPSVTRLYEKNNYFLILFAETNIVSATLDMRKYIFPKNARSASFSCFFSVPVFVPCRSVAVVPAIINLCL